MYMRWFLHSLLLSVALTGCQIGLDPAHHPAGYGQTGAAGCPKFLFLQYQRGEISYEDMKGQCAGATRANENNTYEIGDNNNNTGGKAPVEKTNPCLPITLKYSKELSKFAGVNTEKTLEGVVRAGLKALSGKYPGAKDLACSGQTLYLVCLDGSEGKAAGFKPADPMSAGLLGTGSGETKGDFDASKKPRYKGKAIIGLNCDYLSANNWYGGFGIGKEETMWQVLLHEILHATNQSRRHPPDTIDRYVQWVKDFLKATIKETASAKKAGVK